MRTFAHVVSGVEADPPSHNQPLSEYVQEVRNQIMKIHEVHAKNLLSDQAVMKRGYDEKTFPKVPVKYKVGDLVWVRDKTAQNRPRRFQSLYAGPMQVVEVLGTHTLRLKNIKTNKFLKNTTHVNNVRPYLSPDPPTDIDSGDLGRDLVQSSASSSSPSAPLDSDISLGQPDVYAAKRILRDKVVRGKRFFLVEWMPIDGKPQKNTWEPESNCNHALLSEYTSRKD